MWWHALLSLGVGIAVLYLALIIILCAGYRRSRTRRPNLREALRLLPDLIRLLTSLAADPALPRGVRARLVLLLAYLASPIDLIPDFVPVLGYADDAIVVALALRSVARKAGKDAIDQHWRGSADGLALIHRLVGTRAEDGERSDRDESAD